MFLVICLLLLYIYILRCWYILLYYKNKRFAAQYSLKITRCRPQIIYFNVVLNTFLLNVISASKISGRRLCQSAIHAHGDHREQINSTLMILTRVSSVKKAFWQEKELKKIINERGKDERKKHFLKKEEE